jgi:hypothetical protein
MAVCFERPKVIVALVATVIVCGCHRASPSEVGEAERASAFLMAEMQTARHASDISPGSVAQAALGTPMREAPVAGMPTPASSQKLK